MTFFKKVALAAAATGLAAAPIAAQSTARVAAPETPTEVNELGGDLGAAAIILAIGAIGMGIILITDDDDDDVPTSP